MIKSANVPDDEESLLTVEQTAKRLQVSKSIVYSLIEAGKLICHRIGLGRGTIRVSAADLESYLADCRVHCGASNSRRPRKRLRHIDR